MKPASRLMKAVFRILKILMGENVREPALGLSIWLAILGILATIHADVFEQTSEPVRDLFERPLARIFTNEPPPISLSSLLHDPNVEAEASSSRKGALYVFALDVSKSMRNQALAAAEAARYQEGLQVPLSSYERSGCAAAEPESLSGFDVARFELCRYITAVPYGNRAALWAFGATPKLTVPASDHLGGRWLDIRKTETGGSTKQTFFNAIAHLEPQEDQSNFESLLKIFSERYQDEIQGNDEVHFIIVSDFSHDIGGYDLLEQIPDDPQRSAERDRWESRYRLSTLLIEERLRELSRPGKTFHLSVVLGARRVFYSVLPIAADTIEWSAYKEIRMRPERLKNDFDFLRPYKEVEEPIIFYYAPGKLEPLPAKILVDSEKYKDSELRLALASEEASASRISPLRIKVSFREAKDGLVRMGRGHVGKTGREGDEIVLQPSVTLPSQEAVSYRLLVSWNNGKETNPAMHNTYAARIVFKKRLSLYGAIAMAFSIFAVLFFFLWTLIAVAGAIMVLWRDRASLMQRNAVLTEPSA